LSRGRFLRASDISEPRMEDTLGAPPSYSVAPATYSEPPTTYSAKPSAYSADAPGRLYNASARSPGGSYFMPAVVAALVLVLIVLLVARQTSQGLANSLAARGWVLYTRPGCPYCTKQLDELGLTGKKTYPRTVVCGSAPALTGAGDGAKRAQPTCEAVSGVPFWFNVRTAASRTGLQNRKALEHMLRHPGGGSGGSGGSGGGA
jgi:hypothetical protein